MSNLIDRLISYVSPAAGVRRAHARKVLAYYEAAKSDRLRKNRRETGSGNLAVSRAGSSLRQQARHLEQNYDIARGVLGVLIANTVGPNGIGVEPQPRRKDGSIHDEFARQLLELYKDWSKKPEVTWCHDWPAAQRLIARTWFRDGECMVQTVEGMTPYLDHGTRVPFSVEMMEPDLVPMDKSSSVVDGSRIEQGIEINAWGRPMAFHVLKEFPGEGGSTFSTGSQTKRISADRMLHIATRDRIRQLRGVSVFASVLNRFDDLKDYEESERVAAKVAASMAAFIKKGSPDLYAPPEQEGAQRQLRFRPGMVFDDLRPGEEIGTIDTNRPNPNLETYRSGQIKAIAAGTGPTFSSVAKTYDGTYSAQRQELVEGWIAYATLSAEFAGRVVRPVWEKFVALSILSGAVKVPADIDRNTLNDAIFIGPQMPWIDPFKEAEGWKALVRSGFASEVEVIRRRGGNPFDVIEQILAFRTRSDEKDLVFDSDAAKTSAAGTSQDYLREKVGIESDTGQGVEASAKRQSEPSAQAVIAELTKPLADLATGVQAVADREAAPISVTVAPAAITVEAPQIHNHLPEPQVTVEANVQPAAVTVENTVQAGDVNVVVPEQPAPVVQVTNEVQPAPISEVAIVAMPTRETTTEVTRDGSGNIKTSTQTEKDA